MASIIYATTLEFLQMAESSKDSIENPIDPEGLETFLNPEGCHALCFKMGDEHNTPPSVRTRWLLDVAEPLREAAKDTEYSIWLDIPYDSAGHVVFEGLQQITLM